MKAEAAGSATAVGRGGWRAALLGVSPEAWFLALAVPIFCWLAYAAVFVQFASAEYFRDIWEHTAAIKALMEDLVDPPNPHLASGETSARFMPFFVALAAAGRAFDLSPFQAFGAGGVFNCVLLPVGIFFFMRRYFENRWAPLVGLMVLLGGWGLAWVYTSNYQLRSLFYCIAYPSIFATGLSLVLLAMATRMLRQARAGLGSCAVLCLVVALAFTSHPLTGAFAIGSLGLLAMLEPRIGLAVRLKVIAGILAGAAIVELWPYFSVWELILGTSSSAWSADAQPDRSWLDSLRVAEVRGTKFHDPLVFLITTGPALLGLPVLVYLAARREHLFLVAGFAVMTLPFVADLYMDIPLGHRFLYYMMFFLHLALVWAILRSGAHWRRVLGGEAGTAAHSRRIVGLTGGGLALTFGPNLALAVVMFAGFHPRLDIDPPHDLQPITRYAMWDGAKSDMSAIAAMLPEDAVVVGLPWHTWAIPAFRGKVVSLLHANPFVRDGGRRRHDAFHFVSPEATLAERIETIERYGVTHIVYREDSVPEPVTRAMRELGEIAGRVDAYELIAVRRPLPEPG